MRNRILIITILIGFAILTVGATGVSEYEEVSITSPQSTDSITAVPGSISDFEDYPVAVFAGGCFWGVENLFERQDGVLDAVSGYTGGTMEFPTYRYVSMGNTGHVEAVAVFYDPEITDYETLATYFFEIHDPTQVGGQGPDIGPQYESVIFYGNEEEATIARTLMNRLEDLGYSIATRIEERSIFYRAEGYHQDYYENKGGEPYCHVYTPRFLTEGQSWEFPQ